MNQFKTVKIIVTLLTIVIILTISFSAAQTPVPLKVSDGTEASVLPANLIWNKTIGGPSDDRAFFAVPAGDGYLIVGSSRSIVANTTVGWVLKLDENGNEVWNKTFLEGFGMEIRCVVNLTDGFLLVGNQFLSSGDVNGYVAKIGDEGNLLWQTFLDGGSLNKLFSGIATTDGFAVFGLTQLNDTAQSAGWVVKLNGEGNVVWNETYGQPNETALRSGVLAQDGDYIIAGYTDLPSVNNYDFYLLKIRPDGSLVWNKTYGGVQSEKAYSMTKDATADGYVLVGEVESQTTSTDAWVLKVDENGNKIWDRTVGGKEADSPAYVTQSKDGGYLVAGFTFSFGAGNRDFWLFKINDQGQVLFSCTQGDAGYQEAYCVIEAKRNSYVMAGWTDPLGHSALIGKKMYDFYITELTPQNSAGPLGLPLTDYAVIIISILAAISLLTFKLRTKVKK